MSCREECVQNDNTSDLSDQTHQNIGYKIVNRVIGFQCNRCGEKLTEDLGLVWQHITAEHSAERKPIKCADCELYFQTDTQLLSHYSERHFHNKQFTCDKCFQSFESVNDFWSHANAAIHTRVYVCDDNHCQYSALSIDNIETHRSVHSTSVVEFSNENSDRFDYSINMIDRILNSSKAKKKKIRCNVCDKNCSSAKYLSQHMLVHSEKTFQCDYCGKYFASKSKLTRHQNLSHFERRLICEYCGYKTNDNYRLETHRRRVHIKERRFTCDEPQCDGKSFFKKSELIFHQSVMHSNVRPFVCQFAQCESKGFVSEQQLKRHQRVVHCEKLQYVCFWPECDAAYKYKKSLNLHINYHLNGHHSKKIDSNTNKDFNAHKLSFLDNKSNFVEMLTNDKQKQKQIDNKTCVKCNVCEKQFATQALMRKHVRRVHQKQTASAFKCHICGHNENSKNNLDLHIRRVHKLAYSCYWPECNTSFNNKYLFNEHLLSHTGLNATNNNNNMIEQTTSDLRYSCEWPQCNASFKKKYSLTIHTKVHKNNQLFACNRCEFVAKSNVSLHLHRRRHFKSK